jgi:DNA-binding beta-propeller fold protein YncE
VIRDMFKRTFVCAVSVFVIGCSLPACAFAVMRYPFVGQLTGFSNGGEGIAFDEKTEDTLIGDRSGEVKVFNTATRSLVASWNGSASTNPPGTPSGAFGGSRSEVFVAVYQSTGYIYVADSRDDVVDILKSNGEYVGQLTGIPFIGRLGSVAVDQATGNVYVGDEGTLEHEKEPGVVDVFNAKGEYTSQLSGYQVKGPSGIAVDDQTGKILVAEGDTGTVSVFNVATGAYETTWNGSSATNPPGTPQGKFSGELRVTVDESNGHVYVAANYPTPPVGEYGLVDEFEGSGAYLGQITAPPSESFSVVLGIAVATGTRDVYVGSQGVDIFGPGVLFPGVTTEAVEAVKETGATLTGAVNPEGEPITFCEFEYGTSTGYGHREPCRQTPAQIGSGRSSVAVNAEVSGLEAGAYYHYRLVAGNAGGTEYGADKYFIPTNELFGFPIEGSNAFSVVVSNSVIPGPGKEASGIPYPSVADPNDLDTQAGSHPFAMTVNFRLKTTAFDEMTGEQYAKDIAVNLPAGFAGSIVSVPQCPMYDLMNPSVGCPTSSQIGTVVVWQSNGKNSPEDGLFSPVYNMVPSDGGTAELSFPVGPVAQPVIVRARTDGDYGLLSMTTNISEGIAFSGLTITLWGDPADPRHDPERFLPSEGAASLGAIFGDRRPGNEKGGLHEWGEPLPDGASPSAYLTNPTHCSGAIDATIVADSWTNPGRFNPVNGTPDLSDPKWVTETTPMYPEITGCNKLKFNPSIEVTPDTAKANSPSGYAIHLHVPQSMNPNDLATPALENAVATLPQGLVINPGAADGLQACTSDSADSPGSPGNEIGLKSNAEPTCPAASQIGSVELKTPLLPDILYGQIYLSSEHSGNQYGVFVVIRGEGLLVKLHSTVIANAVTGQLTASFLDNPELPFSDFTMHFYGGPRAVFVNPVVCGPATTTTDLTSWASEPGGLADMTPSSTFDVSFDGSGAPCPSPQPFAPEFRAGTTSIQAGGFSPLTTTFSRPDEDQLVNHVQVTTPPGLLGTLRNVPLCPEPQASEGTCSRESQIGHTIVAVGSGAAPLYLPVPGQPEQPVYVTGPYRGAPFGLTFVVPAVAGPYDLGNVVVRAAINVDPKTAQLTVTSDPLPTIIDGIPVQVKTVNVVIDRPDFVFNPTNCNPMSVGGSVTSLQGSTATLSSPFQVTGCGDLKFKPVFKVSTSAHTSRSQGADLDVRLSFAKGALGKQANIAKVKVDLPRRLPSRLETLKQACTAATFAVNPGLCPKGSIVGVAKAVTQTLPDTLSGPVYFVSHGGEEFPSLIIVLQGDGVRVDLTGSTFINEKTGITSSTFKTVPDVPVESFELYLPQGHFSALAAIGNLCTAKNLVMPTVFTAQNGLTMQQNTPIAVTGCGGKAARARSARKHKHKHPGKTARTVASNTTGGRTGRGQ